MGLFQYHLFTLNNIFFLHCPVMITLYIPHVEYSLWTSSSFSCLCKSCLFFKTYVSYQGFMKSFPSTWPPRSAPRWILSAAMVLRPHYFFTLNMLIATVRLHALESTLFSSLHLLGTYFVIMYIIDFPVNIWWLYFFYAYAQLDLIWFLCSLPLTLYIYQFHTILIIGE